MSESAAQSPTSDSQPSNEEPQAKRTRSSARLGKTRAAEAVASTAQDELVADLPALANNSDGGDTDYEPDDGLVACPICHRRMKMALINSHLDSACSTSMTIPQPERLPSVSYSLLNDSALRKKMGALGLATFGSRQLLERRHKEWTTIWNANCDSARPKRRGELLHDMDIWERTIGVATSSGVGASGTFGGLGTGTAGGRGPSLTTRATVSANQQTVQIKDKDFDSAAWSAKHDLSFQDLIANARKSRSKQQEKTSEDASDTQSANQTVGGKEQSPEQRIEEQPLKDEPQTLDFTGLAMEESAGVSSNVFELGDASDEKSGAPTGNDTLGERTIASKPDSLLGDRAGLELT
ncbi:E3 ubiquitin-protein ligase rad18 [Sporothrix epigloea]|uniref:RING-type E3 ubiquitin transferase n=1 Tax=Sporothrix epigloea TaxID=1892477 RepID=A0ABP0E560_9PEZI